MRANEFINEDLSRRDLLKGAGALAIGATAGSAFAGANDMKADFEWTRMQSNPKELAVWKERQASLIERANKILSRLKSKVEPADLPFVKSARIAIHTDHTIYAWAQVGDDKLIEMDLAIFWDLSNDCIAYVLGHELGHLVINGRKGTRLERRRTDIQNRNEEMACDVYGAKLAYSLGFDPKKAYDNFSYEVKSWKTEGGYPGYVDRRNNVRQQTGIPVASASTPEMIQHNMNAIRVFMQAGPNTVA